MSIERQTRQLAARAFRQKHARRRVLAALPFPEKISRLVQLQQIAAEVRLAAHRSPKTPWKLTRSTAR
jgi:hypothetical protein